MQPLAVAAAFEVPKHHVQHRGAGDDGHRTECRARCPAGVDHQRQQHDRRGVGDRDLRGDRKDLRTAEPERVDHRQCQCGRRRCHQDGVERRVTRVEHACQHDAEDGRHGADEHGAQQCLRQCAAQRGVAHRHVGADDEHHQREADVGEQGERRIGCVDDPESGSADDDPGDELTDDDRDAEPGHRSQQRPGHADDGQQRQRVEPEPRHLSGSSLPGHQPARDRRVLVGQIAGAHPVVAVGDLHRCRRPEVTAYQQDRRQLLARVDLGEVILDAQVGLRSTTPARPRAGCPWPCGTSCFHP